MATKPTVVRSWIEHHPELYHDPASNTIYCSKCETSITAKKSNVKRHIETAKHQEGPKKTNEDFYFDLVQFLILCNIPWSRVNQPAFRTFLLRYICCNCTNVKEIPDESLLRKVYLDKVLKKKIASIHEEIGNQKLWISLDETTDYLGRYVVHFLVKPLNGAINNTFLIACKVLEVVNGDTIAHFVIGCLQNMWGDSYETKVGDVLVLCSDSVAYMLKAGRLLKNDLPNMIHVTCLAHALNRVAEQIRAEYLDVDMLISNVKKIFLKAPNRVKLLKEKFPNIPVPPEPVITRWGTWLEAASYYAKYFEEIKTVVRLLSSSDALSIRCAKSVLEKDNLKTDLNYIDEYYKIIRISLQALQKSNLSLTESLHIFDEARIVLSWCSSETIKTKLENVISRNPDLDVLRDICENIEKGLNDENRSLSYYKYVPITSVDVERSFSIYKWILSVKRNRLDIKNMEKLMIIYINSSDENKSRDRTESVDDTEYCSNDSE